MTKHRLWTADAKYHGKGPLVFAWHPDSNHVATAGENRIVHIFNRSGEVVDEIPLDSGGCVGMDWDKDGEKLAVIQQGSGIVPIWDINTHKVTNLDTSLKDLSFVKWSRVGPQLAIGTGKGNLLIYNKKTQRKIPTLGKHTKKIIGGMWNVDNKLALGSEDHSLTISNADGDTLDQSSLKYDPHNIQFANMKTAENAGSRESTISINMGKKTIFLYNLNDADNPIELAFQPRYGNIVSYRWFGDGYIMLGFSAGFLVVISSHMKEIGQELFSHQFHRDSLCDIAISSLLKKAATCGDNCVKIIDLADWKQVKTETIVLEDEDGLFDKMQWTSDGQILSVSTKSGCLYNFLTRLPVLNASNLTKVLYLSSLRELSIIDFLDNSKGGEDSKVTIEINTEPSFVALGPVHVGVAMNNRAWFYRAKKSSKEQVAERDYIGTVAGMSINRSYAAVLADGKIQLHLIEPPASDAAKVPDNQVFPTGAEKGGITCMALLDEFLVYGTQSGGIHYFYLADWAGVNEFKHNVGIVKLFPNPAGTRVVVIDAKHDGYLYSPVNDQMLQIPDFSQQVTKVLWDSADKGVFVTVDSNGLHTYVYSPASIKGPSIVLLDSTKLPFGHQPILCHNGSVGSQSQSGIIVSTSLTSHEGLVGTPNSMPPEQLRQAFNNNIRLLRFKDAWDVSLILRSREHWQELAKAALHHLDLDTAIRVHRQLGDPGMVMSLSKLATLEEKNLLCGYISMLSGDYSAAQDFFLSSSQPVAALDMRRDLFHWEEALKLAQSLDTSQIPYISREHAQQLEFKSQYNDALKGYEAALTGQDDQHNRSAKAGQARMLIRMGEIRKGIVLAEESKNKQLCRECAAILASMKQYPEAAAMYVKGEQFEKAAEIYISIKNFAQAAPLMEKITTPKLHIAYARAKESERDYKAAEKAYERARDNDNVVRLNLEHLNNPQKAFNLVRQTKSAAGAQYVSRFCQEHGNYEGAIEFLVVARKMEEAFALATQHDAMDQYAQCLGEFGQRSDYLAIAEFFESKGNKGQAGHYYAKVDDYSRALKLFLECGDAEIQGAIDVVGKAKDEELTNHLIDFLMGERDGIPKDPRHIFGLYLALGNFLQAAKTGVIIARQEQDLGNYKVAHDILFDTYKKLVMHKIKIPTEMSRNLMILHSYLLVKVLVKQGNHVGSARMLIRVAKNISKFPSHVVPILTSTVIECQRSGLKRSAFEYARTLMQPEYRANILPQFKPKVERMVRKPDKSEEDEATQPCPICSFDLPVTQLDCPSCKTVVPYCIITGNHVVKDDLCACPSCSFPASYSAFTKHAAAGTPCPMCTAQIAPAAITKTEDGLAQIKDWIKREQGGSDDD